MKDWSLVIEAMQSKGVQDVQGAINDIKDKKEKLDEINFNGIYKSTDKDLFLPKTQIDDNTVDIITPAETVDESHCVYVAYQEIKEALKGKETYIGAISHGCHGIDFLQYYFPDGIISSIEWAKNQEKRVMILLEAPANNLDVSFGYLGSNMLLERSMDESLISAKREKFKYFKFIEENPSITQNDSSPEDFKKHLSSVRWWLDGEKDKKWYELEGLTKCLSVSKKYGPFVAAIMRIFGLTNVYATNLMRFELFEIPQKNGREQSINWEKAIALHRADENESPITISYNKVFSKELEIFEPDIILATANPYSFITTNNDKYAEKTYKILHPANYNISKNNRHCINICHIAKALVKENIIEKDEAKAAITEYYLNSVMAESIT